MFKHCDSLYDSFLNIKKYNIKYDRAINTTLDTYEYDGKWSREVCCILFIYLFLRWTDNLQLILWGWLPGNAAFLFAFFFSLS